MTFSLDDLRRWPDVEAPDLVASDAADRLLLDESASARREAAAGGLVVIGDGYGALTLSAAADGGSGIRVHQDPLTGERALAANAHRAASRIESGFIWVNGAGPHFLGVSFGGYKQSGNGREESYQELLSFTQTKNININL